MVMDRNARQDRAAHGKAANLAKDIQLDVRDTTILKGLAISAIVLIVGAHFIPLALIFRAPQHRTTGVALMLCAAMALVLPASIRDVVECVTAGLILWVSGAGALYAAFRMAPRPPLAAQARL